MNQPFNTTTPLPHKGYNHIKKIEELPPKLRQLYEQCNNCFGVGYTYTLYKNGIKEKVPCNICKRNPKE